MKYIVNNSNNPMYNLAFEEYCFKELSRDNDYVILWINGPAIIIGKNQNAIEEINSDYVEENDIKVVRRVTGGGAVYHDLGNLNFSIITDAEDSQRIDFKKFNIPVLNSLKKLGLNCELSGRNDMTLEGQKFSGIAQSVWRNRVLNHGTLLFDTKLDVLSKALNVKQDKIASKGVKSVRSRVTNIKDHLEDNIDIYEFRDILLKNIFEADGLEPIEYKLTEKELSQIQKSYDEKYSTWEWNYGKSPKAEYKNYKRYPFGSIDIRFNLLKGLIKDIKIYGDFFGTEDVSLLENQLNGIKYDKKEVFQVIENQPLEKYFGDITKEEFINLLFQ